LFTFNIEDERIKGLQGLSVPSAEIRIEGSKHKTNGPLLVTHWGLSGPAILKMSAIAARDLADVQYRFFIVVNWAGGMTETEIMEEFVAQRKQSPTRIVKTHSTGDIPARLWNALLPGTVVNKRWADLSNLELSFMVKSIVSCRMEVNGKSTFKEEFVTAGGVDLKEVNFKTMESKLVPGLFFAGEVLNVDAVTGGFNFQAAWTEAYIAAEAISAL
jgi:predicted Rossmann fold flavoprotein